MSGKDPNLKKTLEALNGLQKECAAISAEVMRLSARISDALSKTENAPLLSAALEDWADPRGSRPARAGELDIF
jgi:hypothetical protein